MGLSRKKVHSERTRSLRKKERRICYRTVDLDRPPLRNTPTGQGSGILDGEVSQVNKSGVGCLFVAVVPVVSCRRRSGSSFTLPCRCRRRFNLSQQPSPPILFNPSHPLRLDSRTGVISNSGALTNTNIGNRGAHHPPCDSATVEH